MRFGLIFKWDPISSGTDRAFPMLAAFNHNQRVICRVPAVGYLPPPFLGQLVWFLLNALLLHATDPMPMLTPFSLGADCNDLINLI